MKPLAWLPLVLAALAFSGCGPNNLPDFVSPEEQQQMDLEAIDQFLTANNITAVRDGSGLRYVITEPGTGARPNITNTVTVRYTGRLLATNAVFDQQLDPPVSFPLRNLIPAWQIAIPKLSRRGKITLFVPSGLGYGTRGSPPAIPANAVLIFDVELVDFR